VDLTAFADALQQSGLSEWMRASLKALPIIESVHVMAVATVYGTILLVDLRLLGLRDVGRPFTRVFKEMVRWTWPAFALAVVTGALMFMPNARTYIVNTAFALKMSSLVLAGINMAVFEFTTLKSVASWDADPRSPLGARIAGAVSIVVWTAVIVFGRWIGFTKGYDFSVPNENELDFSFPQGCLDCLDFVGLG
jgi:hypothetical protein